VVQFTNLSSGDYDTCSWDFGDGGTSNECVDPQHTYSSKGVYDVSLTVTGDGGESTETKVDHITVYEQPVAGFSGEPTEGIASLDVQFTNLSTGDYDTCTWDFGDGGTSADCDDPLYTYTAGGVYTVTLTVSIPGGEDTETKPDYITVYDPAVAEFSAEPTGGLSPLDVEFTNLSSGDYDTCSWDFGDSSTSSDCNDPPHTYTNPGVYTVSLTVSGNGGENTETKVDYITVNENVFADFSADPTYGPAQLAVQFTNLSDGDYDTCSWDFGDGNTSNECVNPINTYINPGLYTVTLTASGIGGEDTMTKEDYITVYTPVEAVFSATPTEGRAPLHVTFTNLSTGDYDTCTWNFGDGTTYESCGKISYTYTVPGNYTVSLTVKGNGGEDVETKLDYIVVDPPLHYNYMPIILGNEMEAESTNLIQSMIILFTNWLS
jgi:PKD repeat protein